ncbi:hypothetical protein GCM10027053_47670 [Intrasporangium mesophilum]
MLTALLTLALLVFGTRVAVRDARFRMGKGPKPASADIGIVWLLVVMLAVSLLGLELTGAG